jgi:hypothetical protein
MESQNFEQWKKVEENVDEAEKNKRQGQIDNELDEICASEQAD